jgi:hypothetical protein
VDDHDLADPGGGRCTVQGALLAGPVSPIGDLPGVRVCLHSRGTIAGWYDAARLAHHATVEQHVVVSSLTEAEIVIVRILHSNQDAAGKVVSSASRPLQREVL